MSQNAAREERQAPPPLLDICNTLAVILNLPLLLLFCVTQAVASVSALFLFQDALCCLSAISDRFVNIVRRDSSAGLLHAEAILCALLDVCKCVVEVICRPDEYDRNEKLFN